ncbi:glycosyltransferase family 4 protein [Candidatus Acidulodesulfobacterium sp. H_13]|uniref:glycosyltransferase family 4 protein n=1 Tax=Candidatus Acidulodesulfobacterium sp. H_13 TaxID=3395470 RepID=UPI003AF72EE9
MKILEIVTPSNIGGAENYVLNLSKKFVENGHEVFILSSNAGINKKSVLSIFEFLSKSDIPFKILNINFKYNPIAILKIACFIKQNKFDIIHTHLSKANIAGALAAKVSGTKSISTAHGLNKKSQYRYAGLVICVSDAVRENLLSQGMSSKSLVVIHNGIDIEKFSPDTEGLLKKESVINDDLGTAIAGDNRKNRFNVGIIARLSREKGVGIFLDAARSVLNEIPEAKFFIAGTGILKDNLIKKAKDLDIYDSVYFLGFVGASLVPFLNELDVVVFPSLKEGLPLSLLEAMAMEKTVIASDAGGMPEVVEDGKSGFIVKRGDAAAIYQKLISVYNSGDHAIAMGKEARKTIAERFNINICADKTLKLFQSFTSASSP